MLTDRRVYNLSLGEVVALKRAVRFKCGICFTSSPFSTDSASQLDVLGHNGDPLGMDSAQVGVFEEADEVSFASLLQCHDSRALEAQFCLEVLGDFTHKSLEGKFSDQQLGALLVATDFTEGDGTWPVSMWFLDAAGGRRTFPGRLGGQLLPRGFSSGALSGSLLGASHV